MTLVCPSRFVSPLNKISVACPSIRGPRTTSATLTTARNITNITRYFSSAIKRTKRCAVSEKFSDFSTGIPTVLIRDVRSSEPGMCCAGFSSFVSFSVLISHPRSQQPVTQQFLGTSDKTPTVRHAYRDPRTRHLPELKSGQRHEWWRLAGQR